MRLNKTTQTLLLCVIVALSSAALTYYSAPTKVKIEEVEVVKEVIVEKVVEVKVKDTETKTTTNREIKPDGTITEIVVVEEKAKETTERVGEKKEEKLAEKSFRKQTSRPSKKWSLSAGVLAPALDNFSNPEFYGSVNLNVIGPFHINILATNRGQFGAGIGFSF